MARTDPKLRAEAARLLARGWFTDDVGLRIGTAGTTVRSWRRNDPEFQRMLAAERRSLLGEALYAAQDQIVGQPIGLAVRVPAGATREEKLKAVLDAPEINHQEES